MRSFVDKGQYSYDLPNTFNIQQRTKHDSLAGSTPAASFLVDTLGQPVVENDEERNAVSATSEVVGWICGVLVVVHGTRYNRAIPAKAWCTDDMSPLLSNRTAARRSWNGKDVAQ